MSNDNNQPKKRMTKRQLQRQMLERVGQKTPEQQVLEFQRRYLANWMSKQGSSHSNTKLPPSSDISDEGNRAC